MRGSGGGGDRAENDCSVRSGRQVSGEGREGQGVPGCRGEALREAAGRFGWPQHVVVAQGRDGGQRTGIWEGTRG